MKSSYKVKLLKLIATTPGALKLGPIFSTSGMVVPMTPDFRALYSSPKALKFLANIMAGEARKLGVELLAGIEMAGVPLAAVTSLTSGIPMVCLRKKPHRGWSNSIIDGAYKPGAKTALIDDALTFGDQKRYFIDAVKRELNIRAILVLYAPDYPKKYRRRVPNGIAVKYLVTKLELLKFLLARRLIHQDTFEVTVAQIKKPLSWQRDRSMWRKFTVIKKRGTL